MKKLLLALVAPMLVLAALPVGAAPPTNGGTVFNLTALANNRTYHAAYVRSLPSGAKWVDGNRLGYVCTWGFLEMGGVKVGRVGFTRLPEAAYVVVNDSGMRETSDPNSSGYTFHEWDGSPYVPSDENIPKPQRCPNDGSGVEPSYTPNPGVIGPVPVITFSFGGQTLEVRDYAGAQVNQTGSGPVWKFEIVSDSPSNVTVIGYQNGQPELAVYYQPMGAGSISSNGVS